MEPKVAETPVVPETPVVEDPVVEEKPLDLNAIMDAWMGDPDVAEFARDPETLRKVLSPDSLASMSSDAKLAIAAYASAAKQVQAERAKSADAVKAEAAKVEAAKATQAAGVQRGLRSLQKFTPKNEQVQAALADAKKRAGDGSTVLDPFLNQKEWEAQLEAKMELRALEKLFGTMELVAKTENEEAEKLAQQEKVAALRAERQAYLDAHPEDFPPDADTQVPAYDFDGTPTTVDELIRGLVQKGMTLQAAHQQMVRVRTFYRAQEASKTDAADRVLSARGRHNTNTPLPKGAKPEDIVAHLLANQEQVIREVRAGKLV